MKIKNNIFLKNSLLYTIGAMATPMIGFILLPFYTQHLKPAEYGTLTTVQSLVGFLQLVLTLSLYGAISRFYYDYYKNIKLVKEYLSTIFTFTLIFSGVCSIILLVFSNQIGPFIFSKIPVHPYYTYTIILSFVTGVISLPLALIRAQEKALEFVIFNILKSILIMITTILLISKYNLGVQGALISQVSITIITTVLLLYRNRMFLHFNINKVYLKESILFSLPLLPHVTSSWAISSADRIILEKFVDVNEIGIYSIAVQISMVLSLFYSSLYKALVPRYAKLRLDNKKTESKKLIKQFSFIVMISGIISIPISILVAHYVLPSSYNGSLIYIPFMLIGQMIYGFYYVFVAKLFYHKKSGSIASSSLIAAILNIVICLITVPILGLTGAVFATIVAELIRVMLIYYSSRKFD
ncbi:hypothetical protein ETI06_12195 [Macrococcoides goetzii]|nr:oligosaccharide flippase family protein [Macrococcus goetzii]TDM46082.1 hypothetical protein ETI06_12195 [Macrococcus goetzii]